MTENPYLDNIRREAWEEASDWQQRAEEIADRDDADITEEEINQLTEELYQKVKDACYLRQEYVYTLPELLTTLNKLAAEWNERSTNMTPSDTDEETIESSFWSGVSMSARDEAERLQFVLGEYLL